MHTIYGTFMTMGDVAEPKANESLWQWMDRTKNYLPNMRSCSDMRDMWSCVVVQDDAIDIIRNDLDWQSNQDNNTHIMVWGNTVFFSDEQEMVVFRLQFAEYIEVLSIITRKEFRYVRAPS